MKHYRTPEFELINAIIDDILTAGSNERDESDVFYEGLD